jgi:hypothetical protein
VGRKVKEYFSCAGSLREYLATLKSCYQHAGRLETAGLTDRYAPIRGKNMGGQLLRCSVSANASCLTTPIVQISRRAIMARLLLESAALLRLPTSPVLRIMYHYVYAIGFMPALYARPARS